MALVKFGGGIAQMAGSIGGTTFARNASGNYARNRTVPVDPNTSYQQVMRSVISILTERWRETLTAAQRTAWATYAAAVAMENRLGEVIHLSGFNHYIRSNSVLLQISQSPVDDGPTELALPSMDPLFACTGDETSGNISVDGDDELEWLDEDGAFLVTYQGVPQNPTRNFYGGPTRLLDTIEGDSVTPPTLPDSQAAVFTLTTGQRVWVAARIIRADGRMSNIFRSDFVVTAS